MNEQPPTSEGDQQPDEPAPFVPAAAQVMPAPAGTRGGAVTATADRPEVSIAAAFAGGLLLALILKRVAG